MTENTTGSWKWLSYNVQFGYILGMSQNAPKIAPRRVRQTAPRATWTKARRDRMLEALRSSRCLADAVSGSGENWAAVADMRRRSAAMGEAWRQAAEQQVERLEQMLLRVALDGLAGDIEEVDSGLKLGVSVGQWLLRNRLPVVTTPPAKPAREPALAPPVEDPAKTEQRIAQLIAGVEARLKKD